MKKNKICAMIAGAWFFCLPVVVLAKTVFADSNTMTVSPTYQKMILTPGEQYRNSITVFNSVNSSRNLKFAVEIGSFSQHANDDSADDYGSVDHVSVSSYNQIMDWISLDMTEGVLAPGEGTRVGYSIDVPEDAPAGGQYATILVVDKTTSGLPGEGNVMIDQSFQFASIIYAEVAGETRQEGAILDNSIPAFLLAGPLETASVVKNNGNVHTDAEYTLQVWPLFGDEEVCTNEEEPETSLILPETERYHTQSCALPAVGIFRAKQIVKIFEETSVLERTVIMCPLWLLFLIVLAIVALIIWLFVRAKGRKSEGHNSN